MITKDDAILLGCNNELEFYVHCRLRDNDKEYGLCVTTNNGIIWRRDTDEELELQMRIEHPNDTSLEIYQRVGRRLFS